MSLEVDGRHSNVPVLYQSESEGFKYVNGSNIPPTAEVHDAVGTASEHVGPPEMSKPRNLGLGRRVRVRQGLIFCWGAAFALVSVLAVVAAGVAGSIAARRGKHIDTCIDTLQNLNPKLSANASFPANTSIGVNSTNVGNSTCRNSNASTFMVTRDCGSLASPYTIPSRNSKQSSNINCGTNLHLHNADIMSVIVFTFEDCIAACASFTKQAASLHGNLTCYGTSFVLDKGENRGPNCYLKGIQDTGYRA